MLKAVHEAFKKYIIDDLNIYTLVSLKIFFLDDIHIDYLLCTECTPKIVGSVLVCSS